MSTLDEAEALLVQLRGFVEQSSGEAKAEALLGQLKRAVVAFQLWRPDGQGERERQLLVARGTMELGCLLSVGQKDAEGFDRHMAQAKAYYNDRQAASLPASEHQFALKGLNLLGLIARNDIPGFHTELELISISERENEFIQFPIQIEQVCVRVCDECPVCE
jgi:hypothetical protein